MWFICCCCLFLFCLLLLFLFVVFWMDSSFKLTFGDRETGRHTHRQAETVERDLREGIETERQSEK